MDTVAITAPCPSCFADRPYPLTVAAGSFLPASDCPECGHVQQDLEVEIPGEESDDPGFRLTLDADGVITRSTADVVNTAAADGVITPARDGVILTATTHGDVLETFRPDDADQTEDYASHARSMGVDPDLVFAALASRHG